VTALLAYPSAEPRLVTRVAGLRGPTYLASLSARSRARWLVARTRGLRNWLWTEPPPDVSRAWHIGVALLEAHEQTVFGLLSEQGPEQRLTLVPEEGDSVVKVAVHPTGDAVIERERANLVRAHESPWYGLGPYAEDRTKTLTEREALVMERVAGSHPKWDDDVYADLKHALTARGRLDVTAALFHGDVTPWNILRDSAGALRLLDWEVANLSLRAHCVCSLLDFVLRGAVVARARSARVRTALKQVLAVAEIESAPTPAVIHLYRTYRHQVREVTTRPDLLSRQAGELLWRCLQA
jgi:hypothetical protein